MEIKEAKGTLVNKYFFKAKCPATVWRNIIALALEDGVLVTIGRVYYQLGSHLRKVKEINVNDEHVTAEPIIFGTTR